MQFTSGLFSWIVFGLSFAGPFLIGLYLRRRDFAIDHGKLIGTVSIILGVLIGVMNMIIYAEHVNFYSGYGFVILFITLMMDALIVPLFAFGTIKILRLKKEKQKWKLYAIVIPIALAIIVSITVIGSTYVEITRIYPESNFSIQVATNSSNSYFIYVSAPLIDNNISQMVNYVDKLSGNVNFSVVTTLYGQALNFSALGSFEVKAAKIGVEVAFWDLSLLNSSDGRYLVFYSTSSGDPINLTLSGHCKTLYTHFSFGLDKSINVTGWNNLEGHHQTSTA